MDIASSTEYYSEHFNHCDHSEQSFKESVFDNCQFHHCDFSRAHFLHCKFIECDFKACNLSLVTISHTSLSDIVFENCKLIGIDWTKAHWPQIKLASPFKFYECQVNQSSFFGLHLPEFIAEQCQLQEVDFRNAHLNYASFTGSDLDNSLIQHCELKQADFRDACHYQINIFENNLTKAKFSFPEVTQLLAALDIEIDDFNS